MPVKELGLAKSRLRGALAGVPHADLVLALVLDTLSAALACPAVAEVLVITADEAAAAAARGLGARFVPDHDGTGTTLLAAPAGVPLDPRFGPGSARAHARSGAVVLPAAPSLRHDVDTAADLAAAARLGLGARTAALM